MVKNYAFTLARSGTLLAGLAGLLSVSPVLGLATLRRKNRASLSTRWQGSRGSDFCRSAHRLGANDKMGGLQ